MSRDNEGAAFLKGRKSAASAKKEQGQFDAIKSKRAHEPIEPKGGKANGELVSGSSIRGAVIVGMLQAWTFLIIFFPGTFSGGPAAVDTFALQNISFVCQLATYAVFFVWTKLCKRWVACLTASVCTVSALIVLKTIVDLLGMGGPLFATVTLMVAVTSGIGMGVSVVSWAILFATKTGHTTVQVAGGLVFSVLVVFVLKLVPFPLSPFLLALLPVGLLFFLVSGANRLESAGVPVKAPQPISAKMTVSPKLIVTLVAVGLAYGLAMGYGYTLGDEVHGSWTALAASLVVGAAILAYALVTGNNFGYSQASIVILPLAVFGQAMVAIYQTELLPLSILVLRIALLTFDSLIWMQLPRVFEQVHDLRGFFLIRLFLEGSVFVGFALRFFLTDGAVMFREVSLGAILVISVALAWTFAGENAITVWDIMPLPAVENRNSFKEACEKVQADFGLTRRELEILSLVAKGRSGAYVQDKLCIAQGTFQTHMRNIYKKLDVHSCQELIDLVEERLD